MKYELNSLIGQITEADCEEVLAQLPDKCVDLVLTDPPYGIDMGGNAQIKALKSRPKWSGCKYPVSNWDSSRPSKKIFDEMRRVSKNQIVWGGNYFTDFLPVSKGWFFWDKCMAHNINFSHGEMAWTSVDTILKLYRYSATGISFSCEKSHPTQKPVPLFSWCLSQLSCEGDIVLDPFSGSGTTALACHTMHRRFICIEREHEYVEKSRNRLRDAQAQLSLFGPAKTEHYGSAENSIQQPQVSITADLFEGEL